MNQTDAQRRDVELLRLIAAGDRGAFAEFYDRHSLLMFSVASRMLNSSGEAEDVLQEVFAQIWAKADKYDERLGKVTSWASALVRNRAIDRIRASQRRTRLVEEAGVGQEILIDARLSANDAVHGRENARLIHSAIIELPAEQRRAIELAYFSGMTQDEISKTVQAPLGTVKARIRRGLLKLRDQLEELV